MDRTKIRILFRSEKIGDTILFTPTLRALKEQHIGTSIVVYYVSNFSEAVLRHNPRIDRLRRWRGGHEVSLGFLNRMMTRIGREPLVRRLGIERAAVADVFPAAMVLGRELDLHSENHKPEIFLTPREQRIGTDITGRYGAKPVVALHTTSPNINKNWDSRNWLTLIKQNPDIVFLQLGAPNDAAIEGAIPLMGLLLRESFAVIRAVNAMVAVDSGLAHAASAFDVPAIVLFGASNPSGWAAPGNTNLYKDWYCSPCNYFLESYPCPFGRPCMNAISVDEVTANLRQRLGALARIHINH